MTRNDLFKHWALTGQIGFNSIIGYVFLKVLANKFGISEEMDGFNIAYSVPFIILNVSGFAFLHGIIAAQFSRMVASHTTEIDDVFSTTLNGMLCFGLILFLACVIFSKEIAILFAPGLSSSTQKMIQTLILLMCPIAFTLGMSTYLSAILFAYAIPIASELPQLITRLGVIIWMLVSGASISLVQIASGLLAWSFISLILVWYVFRRTTALKYRLSFSWNIKEVKDIARQSSSFMVVAILAQASMFYMRRLATLDGPGVASSIVYALSLVSPLSLIIGKPLAQIFGPKYIRYYANSALIHAKHIFLNLFLLCLIFAVAAVVLINLNADTVVSLLYGGGRFSRHAVEKIVPLFRLINWSLVPATLMWIIFIPVLNVSRSHAGARVYGIGYLLHLLFSYCLFPNYGRYGLAWAYIIGISAQAALGFAYVYHDLSAAGRNIGHG
ncbi:MAG TPA: lipid II flippase MurJ [Syntrophorhabdaceae bacterium]|nr:lipid II flippase MurJ [Syntrophorhabdaceae bacterium]